MLKNLLTTYDLQSAVKKCPNLFMLWGFANLVQMSAIQACLKIAECSRDSL